MEIAQVSAFVATCLYIVAPIAYIKGVMKGAITPNPATWGIWGFVGIINALSYFGSSHQDFVLSFLGFVAAAVLALVFVVSLFAGKLRRPGFYETGALILGILTCIVWLGLKGEDAPIYVNLLIQVPLFLGFIPTYIGLWTREAKEQPTAWIFASTAYIVQMIGLMSVTMTEWHQYVWPGISFAANGYVAYLAITCKPKE